ncbi:hypothetical protein C5167_031850 [Papaver somniferum]|uniref:Uncharacterized protein n=1 Tax=Papaver somniferum TaxID=3469 RepID=A0A4Y7K9T7_PAPSO|nr:hypothetical protein C5167_031850 [Papaver somniferum]
MKHCDYSWLNTFTSIHVYKNYASFTMFSILDSLFIPSNLQMQNCEEVNMDIVVEDLPSFLKRFSTLQNLYQLEQHLADENERLALKAALDNADTELVQSHIKLFVFKNCSGGVRQAPREVCTPRRKAAQGKIQNFEELRVCQWNLCVKQNKRKREKISEA